MATDPNDAPTRSDLLCQCDMAKVYGGAAHDRSFAAPALPLPLAENIPGVRGLAPGPTRTQKGANPCLTKS